MGESMRRFEGRVAVVSGAAQGMGRAVAERLGQEGAVVVAVDINGDGANATAKAIGGKSFGIACDIGDEDAVARLFDSVSARCGKLDVLVNNAAIVPFVKWDELTFKEWRRVLRVNLDGLYLMCRAGSDLMRKTSYGRIVNFSSNSIFRSEDAVARLFDSVSARCGKLDVLVNNAAIVPFVKWDELTFKEWRRVLRVNLDGLYLMCRAGSDLMRKTSYGRIVNFSSNSIF